MTVGVGEEGDSAARELALDPSRSFIVQAPAGSGKTELLIQRYLLLLGHVSEPEQVLAITFTRKAAAEMRTRVLDALSDARNPTDVLPEHRLRTRELASVALQRDGEQNWGLAEDPHRIRIRTLDSFNTELAMCLPLLSGGIGGTQIADDATQCYAEAARRSVEAIWREPDAAPGAAQILAELDFSVPRLELLVSEMLAVREQWIHWLLDTDGVLESSRAAIATLQERAVEACEHAVNSELRDTLFSLTAHAHEHADAPMAARTRGITSVCAGAQWRAVANLLLRSDGCWRARVDRRDGFGPQHRPMKQLCMDTLESLQEDTAFASTLAQLRDLPNEDDGELERSLLMAVASLLQLATAELQVLFAQRRIADFTELGLAARRALGAVDEPSDLLLALDQRLQHILVDEFQDTSQAQVDLLQTLTEGWEAGDGRTLFLVGDPMQSIYRFRNADMRLFISARRFGIGTVMLDALHLSTNFRSSPAIVEWVNETFSECFPHEDDLERGMAGYHSSYAARDAVDGDGVTAQSIESKSLDAEHAAVLKSLEAERRAHPNSSIAILVRARGHLGGFRQLLNTHGWHARAVEIDAPHALQLTQDLIGLARALTHLGDRLAWLGLLRAPWCGLRWSDLELLVGDDKAVCVWERMHDAATLNRLTDDARARLLGLRERIADAIDRRGQQPFVQWLFETWLDLGGPDSLANPRELEELDTILALLDRAVTDQDIADVATLEDAFNKPAKQPDESTSSIEIMTIHRSKGLEFDCVILPGLARSPRPEQRRLIEWCDLSDAGGARGRIVAPLRRDETHTAKWIRGSNRELAGAETARLMYVAATRARARLRLIWALERDTSPRTNALLGPLWNRLQDTPGEAPENEAEEQTRFVAPLRRFRHALPCRPASDVCLPEVSAEDATANELRWTASTAAHVGVVVHERLQTLCDAGPESWSTAAVLDERGAIERHLKLLGIAATRVPEAADQVLRALCGVLEDTTGRWIIGAREEARSEIMITSLAGHRVLHQRLDRTFVDDGYRWIIDYKTASHDSGDLQAFLDAEVERYRDQLEGYASAMRQIDDRPIRLGLYFPLLPAFRQWEAQ